MHIFLHKCIDYGHVTRYAYAYSHICLRSWQLKQLPKLVDLFAKHNSNTFVFDREQFPKSQLFANINVSKLFDLPKSRLNTYDKMNADHFL